MNNSSSNETDDCYPASHEKMLFVGLHLAVILIGIPSNVFFLFVSYRLIRQKNELGVYLFNLALSDFLFIMCLPVWVQYGIYDVWPHGKTMCVVCVFLLFTNFYTSAVLLSCIAVDRYIAIVHPLQFCTFRKRKTAASVSVAAWIFTVVFNAMTMHPDSIYDEKNLICLDLYPLPQRQKKVNVARFVVGFLIPALVVGFCYWRIYLDVKRNQMLGSMERRHVFRLLGCISLTLYFCFGPVHIMMVLRVLLESCPYPNWLFIGYKVSTFLSMLNCLADPLLYCFTSRTGQASASNVLLILRRTWKKEGQKERGLQNNQMLANDTVPITEATFRTEFSTDHLWSDHADVYICYITVKMPFLNSMGLASRLIRVQLFLSVQNNLFCCLILKICVSYHITSMYYLNYDHTGLEYKLVLCIASKVTIWYVSRLEVCYPTRTRGSRNTFGYRVGFRVNV